MIWPIRSSSSRRTSVTTERKLIEVRGIRVEVIRKDIKNLHLAVHPPNGRVRVAAPFRLDEEAVRLAVISRLQWIRRKQEDFRRQVRQSKREMVSGESHYFQGHRYRLNVVELDRRPSVELLNNRTIELRVRPGSNRAKREAILAQWQRQWMREQCPDLLRKWEPRIGVEVAELRIKRMKTRWGTCNVQARRIWLNVELVKKHPSCLEYILVHEMVHLIERRHNNRFMALMDQHLPQWRLWRDELNRLPLAHEDWEY